MNNRIKISQSQLARLVEGNLKEQNHSTGKATQNQNNIGIGGSKLVTKTHMDRPAGRLNIMGGTNPTEFKENKMMTDVTCVNKHGECGKAESCEKCGDMSMGPDGGETESCHCSSNSMYTPYDDDTRLSRKKELRKETESKDNKLKGLLNKVKGSDDRNNDKGDDGMKGMKDEPVSNIRRQDKDRMKRRPYSAKARDMRGSRELKR